VDLFRGLIMVIMLIDHTRDCARDGMTVDPPIGDDHPLLYFTLDHPPLRRLCAPAPAGFNVTAALPFPRSRAFCGREA
jgi:hypothetical protein